MKLSVKYSRLDYFTIFSCLFLFNMIIYSCSPAKNLTPDEMMKLITAGDDDLLIIDLRSANDFFEGHIQSARNIPFDTDKFSERIASIENKNQTAVFYCGIGIKTEKALPVLKKSTFKKIFILKGGFESWRKRGYSIVH